MHWKMIGDGGDVDDDDDDTYRDFDTRQVDYHLSNGKGFVDLSPVLRLSTLLHSLEFICLTIFRL